MSNPAVDTFRKAAISGFRRTLESTTDDEVASLISEIRDALEGDSNDVEHDALASVAAFFGIDYDLDK